MKTTEAIEFFKTHDVTDAQGYNILIEDLWDMNLCDKAPNGPEDGIYHKITEADVAQPVAQALIQFFMYQIQAVMFPVIRELRKEVKP